MNLRELDEGVNLWFAPEILKLLIKLLTQREYFNGMNLIYVTPFKYPNSTLFRKIFYCGSDILFEYKPGS